MNDASLPSSSIDFFENHSQGSDTRSHSNTAYSQTPPLVLTIAGSDPSSGAGIQADLKTLSALGVYGMTVITTITAQNSRGLLHHHPLPAEIVREQLAAILDDNSELSLIKIGMIGTSEIATVVARELERIECSIVLDPVAKATNDVYGHSELSIASALRPLLSRAFLITPNIPEAEALTGITIDSLEAMHVAGEMILMMGAKHVLIKGGHAEWDTAGSTDVLVTRENSYHFTAPKITTRNLRGTGCTLSSAIAAFLARGFTLLDAVRFAKEYVSGAIESGRDRWIGMGNGPLDHEWIHRGPPVHAHKSTEQLSSTL